MTKLTHPDIAPLVTPLCFAKRGKHNILISLTLFTRSIERVGQRSVAGVSKTTAMQHARNNQTLLS